MTKPIIKIVNVSTGEEIEREMNDDEFAQYEIDQAAEIERQSEAELNVQAKVELLAKLGLTEAEAKFILN